MSEDTLWDTILTLHPDITIQEGVSCGNATFPKPVCPGSLGFNQGSGNPGNQLQVGSSASYRLSP